MLSTLCLLFYIYAVHGQLTTSSVSIVRTDNGVGINWNTKEGEVVTRTDGSGFVYPGQLVSFKLDSLTPNFLSCTNSVDL